MKKEVSSLPSTSAVLGEFRRFKRGRKKGAEMLALLRRSSSLQVAICLDECGPRLRRTILDTLRERPRDPTWDKR